MVNGPVLGGAWATLACEQSAIAVPSFGDQGVHSVLIIHNVFSDIPLELMNPFHGVSPFVTAEESRYITWYNFTARKRNKPIKLSWKNSLDCRDVGVGPARSTTDR